MEDPDRLPGEDRAAVPGQDGCDREVLDLGMAVDRIGPGQRATVDERAEQVESQPSVQESADPPEARGTRRAAISNVQPSGACSIP
ncbi:hypothetical protein GCM10025881_02590 [Pseudolysinimonas kribbensis]|uniref:Uncharacterized protein n=1 Tax=Pseudolysinimonas kribbensis TaxID=433641 RepID=A0ABQ6JYN7_9MICO|nr:hypothetical protein GCM10025881_02590 [Pseudolysinimonas kribbensis]